MSNAELQTILQNFGAMLTKTIQETRQQDVETVANALRETREHDRGGRRGPPVLTGIKPFCGKRGENLISWSFQVTDMFDAQKLELQDRLRWVTQMLADSALQWYLNLSQSIGKGNAKKFKS